MNPYMPYTSYMPQDAYMQDQMALRQRIDNLSQAQQQYKAQAQPNVNWIQVAGIDGARNQIVQPGTTAWMMDNNAPYFYVKSVDGVGSVTFKAFEFHEVQANNPQPVAENMDAKYVTREEFNKLLDTLKPQPEEQKEILQSRYDAALQAQNMQAQMAQCCCDIKESILADGQATRQLIQDNTIQNLRDKLADRDRDLQTAYWQISQVSQTNNIIDAVRPTPKPAYMSCSPYFAYNAFGNGCCASGNVM